MEATANIQKDTAEKPCLGNRLCKLTRPANVRFFGYREAGRIWTGGIEFRRDAASAAPLRSVSTILLSQRSWIMDK